MQTSEKKQGIQKALRDPKLRYWLCRYNIYAFAFYYFRHYFFCKSAPFHRDMAKDLLFNGHKFLMWIMFRESAKTVWAKVKVLHAICYGYKKNITWVAYDVKKADKQIMSIASELKSNPRLIQDFGQLYYEDMEGKYKKSKIKRLGDFITVNGVSVKASSIMVPTRGDIQDEHRPDMYIIDDIENMKTARSIAITKTVIENMEELLGGVSVDCHVLIIGNRVAKNGSISKIEKRLEENPKVVIHEVGIYDKDGKITWPARFVEEEKEAEKLNALIQNPKQHYRSLSQMRIDQGTTAFNREMRLITVDSAGSPINMEWIKFEPLPDLATLKNIVGVDPAISQKTTADYFAMVSAGRHPSGKIYIHKVVKTRCRVSEQVNLITNWHRILERSTFRIETVAYQQALSQLIQDQRTQGVYIATQDFKPNQDKVSRMNAIAPFIERGDIVFADTPEVRALAERICQFPFMDDGHDDDVDAFMGSVEGFINIKKIPRLTFA